MSLHWDRALIMIYYVILSDRFLGSALFSYNNTFIALLNYMQYKLAFTHQIYTYSI